MKFILKIRARTIKTEKAGLPAFAHKADNRMITHIHQLAAINKKRCINLMKKALEESPTSE